MNYPVLRPLRWFSSEMQLNTPKVPGQSVRKCTFACCQFESWDSYWDMQVHTSADAFGIFTCWPIHGISKVCISGDAISGRLGEIDLRCHSWRLFRPCCGELPGRTVVESVKKFENGDVPEDRWFWREHNGVFLRRFGMFWGSMILLNSFAALV